VRLVRRAHRSLSPSRSRPSWPVPGRARFTSGLSPRYRASRAPSAVSPSRPTSSSRSTVPDPGSGTRTRVLPLGPGVARATPRGFEPRLPDPERRPQGPENGQFDRKWRPDEHRRPVGLTLVTADARRNACKRLARDSPDGWCGETPPGAAHPSGDDGRDHPADHGLPPNCPRDEPHANGLSARTDARHRQGGPNPGHCDQVGEA
jgi:hypothetical protein